jgi:DNA polymerase-2
MAQNSWVTKVRGFVLQASYRVVSRPNGQRVVRRVRQGDLDEALVYRKYLRKDVEDYTATTPPHVVAARKSSQPVGRLVSYVITTAGPEPMDNIQHPVDREHYVQKQVKPVAEPVLETLGLDFERVIGDSRQIDLYSMFGEA